MNTDELMFFLNDAMGCNDRCIFWEIPFHLSEMDAG